MGQKFVILPDPVPTNQYRFTVAGLPPIVFVTIGSLESELDCVELDDRTFVSTGRTKPGEFEVGVPTHHLAQIAAMEAWYQEAKEPVSPTYKKTGIMTQISGTTLIQIPRILIGVFTYKRSIPEQEMKGDGEMSVTKYMIKWDDWN